VKQIVSIGSEGTSSQNSTVLAKQRYWRDALVAALVLFLASAAANTVLYLNASGARQRILEDLMRAHVRLSAEVLDPVAHSRLTSAEMNGSPDHLAQLQKLQTIRRAYPQIKRLYTMRADEKDNLSIILDTFPPQAMNNEPPKIGRPPDHPLEKMREALVHLRRGELYEMSGTAPEDQVLGVMTPLPRQTSGFIDFVIADISNQYVATNLSVIRAAYYIALLVSLALALAGGFAVYLLRLRELVARQMSPGESEFFRKVTAVLPGLLYQARVSPLGQIKLTYASEDARSVCEMEPEELRRDPAAIVRLIHPDDRKQLKEKMLKANKGSKTWQEEFRVVLPKAGVRWRLGVAHVEKLADGSSLWHGFVTDTTARKQADEALRKNEASLKAAQQVAAMGSWELDLSDPTDLKSKTLRWSDETFRVFGLEPNSVPVSHDLFFQLVHPDDRALVEAALSEAVKTRGRYSLDHRIILAGGAIRHVHEDAVILHHEKTGNSIAMLGTVHDITGRVRREEAVRRNEQRLKLATQAGRVGTWDYDVATKKIHWNDVMFTMKKLDPATFDPNLDESEDLLHPDDRARVMAEFNRCLSSRETRYESESRISLRDGEVLHTRSIAEIIRDANGQAVRCVGIEIDVTAEKHAIESALAADRAKSEFLAMMSHEIRTPMNGVLGFTALLKETALAGDQEEYVTTIESSGQHLLHLINDILDLSKIESGRIKIHPAPFALRPFLQELFTLLRPRATEKHLDYRWNIEANAPEIILTDRTRLGQILTNLLGNAVKFTDRGKVHLQVMASKVSGSDNIWQWNFTVQDTGPGIAAGMLHKIFDPFYQADLSVTRRHGGTGLGLAISRRLARLLGGEISVTSRLGDGSEFTATILAPEALLEEPVIAPTASETGHFPGKKVLIVDDDPVGRKLCNLQLTKLGFVTVMAANGSEAVAKSREQQFDAILMDVQMPDMDGFTATREIRRFEKKRTPIIALTANAMIEDRERSLEAGMDDYISKPMKLDVLTRTLARWV